MDKRVRTRFAPSPTGYMHIGNLRTALYTYLIAKKDGGDFLLRIEDTDQERFVEDSVEVIYRTLKEAGLDWDEGPDIGGPVGPYVQSERRDIYQKYAKELVDLGGAYYCFCDKERLDELRTIQRASGMTPRYDGHCANLTPEEVEEKLNSGAEYVIRQRMPREGSTSFEDEVFGTITVANEELDDNILLKTDGLPTYNFANVIDDHLMDITHVVRGSEYLSSAPRYNLLYEAFGWDIPVYVHCSPIMRDAHNKLSKRDGDASYEDLVEEGYLTPAILNYIALCGWSPGGEEEIFSLEEMVKIFDIKGISKSPAIFDINKLKHINGEWIRKMSDEEFYETALPWIQKTVTRPDIDLKFLAKLLFTRTQVLSDIPEQVDFIDEMPEYSNDLYVHKRMGTSGETAKEILPAVKETLAEISEADWTEETIHTALFDLIKELDVKNGFVLWPLRIALTGKQFTPGGGIETAFLLGKEDSLARLDKSISQL